MTRAQPIQNLFTTPATSSPGTPGPSGPQGPTRPAGPPRTLQVVERQGETAEISPGLRGFSDAPCLPGGCYWGSIASTPTSTNIALTVDTQRALTGNKGWELTAVNNSPVPILLFTFAECASLST